MRTMPMIWNKGNECVKEGQEPCAVCGKGINPDRMYAVHVINGGSDVVHPEDDHLTNPDDPGEMGCHMVGPECRKRFGAFAFKWSN